MPRTNDQVEAALVEFADLLSIVSDDPFKPRAYEKAARAVGGYPDDVGAMDAKAVLAIPGVGKSIAAKITDYLGSGTFPELEELRAKVPAGVREMTAIPGFGPKKAMAVYEELGIGSVDELLAAADA
ncbi:MAG TPA: helix-hairpin-helix domain-containing protein, partial [Actinomycetota bacterium]